MSHLRLCIAQILVWTAFRGPAIFLVFLPGGTVASQFLEISVGAVKYQVEVAQTGPERRQGLMRRASLDRHSGMLLVYQKSGDHRIWMKNMLIPLRVYWIDSDARVIEMQRLEPCQEAPCPVYGATRASRYVLELSDHEHALEAGDIIEGLSDL